MADGCSQRVARGVLQGARSKARSQRQRLSRVRAGRRTTSSTFSPDSSQRRQRSAEDDDAARGFGSRGRCDAGRRRSARRAFEADRRSCRSSSRDFSPTSLQRRLVDIDYYISLGGDAYRPLSRDDDRRRFRRRLWRAGREVRRRWSTCCPKSASARRWASNTRTARLIRPVAAGPAAAAAATCWLERGWCQSALSTPRPVKPGAAARRT